MCSPKPSSGRPRNVTFPDPADQPPNVSARWLLSAFLITVLAAAICGYAALGLLFYQGQWQLLFHPSRAIANTPLRAGVPFDNLWFDVDETGHPRLNGWWIPASSGASYGSATVLYLHDARGSLSDTVPAVVTLHASGMNIFTFDYQGFGLSSGSHPSERLATADAIAAWTYLTDIRHIPPKNLIVFGDGVGATFAAHLAGRFAPAAVILEDPNPPARQILEADARARFVPLWLLQNEFLDLAPDVTRIHAPLLFLIRSGDPRRTRALYSAAAYPKQIYDLHSAPDSVVNRTLRRFLDEILPLPGKSFP